METKRITVEAAEQLLGQIIPVLDHGEVQLVDYLGGDKMVCRAARVSYGELRRSQNDDRSLIRYLLRHRHTSPFEQVILTFRIKAPIFVFRQWHRHRTARLNEISGRYSVLPEEFYIPSPEQVLAQSMKNKQGRDGELSPLTVDNYLKMLEADCEQAFETYHENLDSGVAKELARLGLPVNTYSAMYWQIDLHNLMHLLGLRMEEHAQWEIRQYAEQLYQVAKAVAPVSVEAFDDYILGSVTFSRQEVKLLQPYHQAALEDLRLRSTVADQSLEYFLADQLGSKREVTELITKLGALVPLLGLTRDCVCGDSDSHEE